MSSRIGRGSEHEHQDLPSAAARDVAPGKRARTDDHGGAVQRKATAGASSSGEASAERRDDWSMSDGMMAAMGLGAASPSPSSGAVGVQLRAAGSGRHRAVQANGGELAGDDVAATAERGVAGASSQLPHLGAIQQAFGHHDVGGVRAQVGGAAAQASAELGAEAYATGDRVAFAQAPDLHTAAHEAAHVVQQAGGQVQLKDGVGQVGDVYEQHADAVANAVVAGKSVEAMLDGFATPARASSDGAGVQKKDVQLVASEYKSNVQIKALSLAGFDSYAHAQADWATSSTLGTDKEKLRKLLDHARKLNGLVLGGCGAFKVSDLIANAIGQGTAADVKLSHYALSASPEHNTTAVRVEDPAPDVATALRWGEALQKLNAKGGIPGVVLARCIPQNGSFDGLAQLVTENAVDDLITYYKDVKPLFDAENGAEVQSFLAFHKAGGMGKYGGYKGSLPEVRNYHRFTVDQLDVMAKNRVDAQTNKAQLAPLPICVVLQTSFDHNGAFHQDPFMTHVLKRTTHITLFAEGKVSLADFSSELRKFAQWGKDDKVDEVMVAGHGNAKLMELGGDKAVGVDRNTKEQSWTAFDNNPLVVDKRYPRFEASANDFMDSIKETLRDDAGARVVLNACLTASNSIDNLVLDPDPDIAAVQIKQAINKDPSLATAMQLRLGTHKGQVRGANASFGKVKLLDGPKGESGGIDIISSTDPKLTAPKLEYAEGGTEPTGVLRATLEAWAHDRDATIEALERRVIARGGNTSWREKVITSVIKIIIANKTNASLIHELVGTAGALGHLDRRAECKVSALKNKVPDAHMKAIFDELALSDPWTDPGYNFVPAVVFQVWIEKNNGKIGAFHTFLETSGFTTQNASTFFDLGHMKPLIAQLVPTPPDPPTAPDVGPTLLALLYMVGEKDKAPAEVKAFIEKIAGGKGSTAFPGTSGVDALLLGAIPKNVLENAGVIEKASAPKKSSGGSSAPVGPTPNLDTAHTGNNTVAVDSVTSKCRTHGFTSTNAYMLPSGNKIGSIPSGQLLHVIGKAKGVEKGMFSDTQNVDYLAVEYTVKTHQTVFVLAKDVQQ